jgi:hypothetical protein
MASTCLLLLVACCVAPAPRLARLAPLIESQYGTVCTMRGNLLVTRGEDRRGSPLLLMKVREVNETESDAVDVWLPLVAASKESREALRVAATDLNSCWSIEVVGWEGLWGLGSPADGRRLFPPRLEISAFDQVPERAWSVKREVLAWKVVSLDRGAWVPELGEYPSSPVYSGRLVEWSESPSLPFDGEIVEFVGRVKGERADSAALALDVATVGGRAVDNCELRMSSWKHPVRSDWPDVVSTMQDGWLVKVVGWHAFSFRSAVRDPHGLMRDGQPDAAAPPFGRSYRALIVCSWERIMSDAP